MTYSNSWKTEAYNQEYSTQKDYHLEFRDREIVSQSKVKGVHWHWTGLIRTVKGTSLSGKQKVTVRRKLWIKRCKNMTAYT